MSDAPPSKKQRTEEDLERAPAGGRMEFLRRQHAERVAAEEAAATQARLNEKAALIDRVLKATDHYKMLDLPRGADEAAIRKRRNHILLMVHPDKCSCAGGGEACEAVRSACETLLDVNRRRAYDLKSTVFYAGFGGSGFGGYGYTPYVPTSGCAPRRDAKEAAAKFNAKGAKWQAAETAEAAAKAAESGWRVAEAKTRQMEERLASKSRMLETAEEALRVANKCAEDCRRNRNEHLKDVNAIRKWTATLKDLEEKKKATAQSARNAAAAAREEANAAWSGVPVAPPTSAPAGASAAQPAAPSASASHPPRASISRSVNVRLPHAVEAGDRVLLCTTLSPKGVTLEINRPHREGDVMTVQITSKADRSDCDGSADAVQRVLISRIGGLDLKIRLANATGYVGVMPYVYKERATGSDATVYTLSPQFRYRTGRYDDEFKTAVEAAIVVSRFDSQGGAPR